ncbi:unnamed protein product [Peniophora sp. CBMAI 1063]|nr:unnamed protein product [Peniophora sp. CBMAI 1063]
MAHLPKKRDLSEFSDGMHSDRTLVGQPRCVEPSSDATREGPESGNTVGPTERQTPSTILASSDERVHHNDYSSHADDEFTVAAVLRATRKFLASALGNLTQVPFFLRRGNKGFSDDVRATTSGSTEVNAERDISIRELDREVNVERPAKRRKVVGADGPGPSLRDTDVEVPIALTWHPRYRHFLAAIRAHFLYLLGVKSLQALDPSSSHCQPLTILEQQQYLGNLPGRVTTTEEHFRFDFQLSRSHPFNLEALRVFSISFLKHVSDGAYSRPAPLPCIFLILRNVEAAIYNHAKMAKAVWYRRFVVQESEEAMASRLATNSRKSRKQRLYRKRLAAITQYAPHHHALVSTAGARGVSSDESSDDMDEADRHQDTVVRVAPSWRSLEFQGWYHSLDPLVANIEKSRVGRRTRRGATSRRRKHSSKVNRSSVAPIGLPRNCYHTGWLADLSPYDLNKLQVLEETYDLTPIQ